MRRMLTGIGIAAVVALLLATAWTSPVGTLAQDQDDDAGAAATIAALEDRVAALETQVAELTDEEDDADEARETDDEASAGPTPTLDRSDRISGQDRQDDDAADAETAAAPSGDEGTRDNPISLGKSAPSGDYTVTVIEVVPDATDLVMAENQFNDPPAAGKQFYLVTVEVTYTGAATGQTSFDLNFQAVGAQAVAYAPFDASCGVVPNDQFQASELFPGGTTQFNVCWAIDSADEASLVMFVEPLFSFDAQPIFFALRDA